MINSRKTRFAALALSGMLAASPSKAGSVIDGTAGLEEKSPASAREPRLKIYGWIEAGITRNFADPKDGQNFGRLFDDRDAEPLLNQVVITAERALDAGAAGFDWGFKAQFLYGSDARFTHSLGLLDRTLRERNQIDVVEAYLSLHFPILTEGGVDLKAGKFVTLEGAETIDPRTNLFYSHSYIFNYGIPLNHTGLLATVHATKWLDVVGGVTRGVNTAFTDNNESAAFHGGLGVKLFDGKLVALASTHIGPETPRNDSDYRYLNDLAITWKITDKLTAITDLNYIEDDAPVTAAPFRRNSRGGGFAQYLTYAVSDWLSVSLREEVWRDERGFFVAQFAGDEDFVDLERGKFAGIDPRTTGGGSTTYNGLTAGLTIKPKVPKPLTGMMIRPEVRWDHAEGGGSRPFDDSRARDMFTAGVDVIFQF